MVRCDRRAPRYNLWIAASAFSFVLGGGIQQAVSQLGSFGCVISTRDSPYPRDRQDSCDILDDSEHNGRGDNHNNRR